MVYEILGQLINPLMFYWVFLGLSLSAIFLQKFISPRTIIIQLCKIHGFEIHSIHQSQSLSGFTEAFILISKHIEEFVVMAITSSFCVPLPT